MADAEPIGQCYCLFAMIDRRPGIGSDMVNRELTCAMTVDWIDAFLACYASEFPPDGLFCNAA
jgi:hypothetical protein